MVSSTDKSCSVFEEFRIMLVEASIVAMIDSKVILNNDGDDDNEMGRNLIFFPSSTRNETPIELNGCATRQRKSLL